MYELALFAGAGGGILGGHLLGWRTVCAVERDAYAAAVLAQRQNDKIIPAFPIWSDVCSFDGGPWRGLVDVISGGFPCQDISAAGKGAGITGERSGLWKEFARIIGEVRPAFAFIENSPMLTKRGLSTVLEDLAALGYDAEWLVLGARDCGAPHKRERIWVLAYSNKAGFQNRVEKALGQEKRDKEPKRLCSSNPRDDLAYSNKEGNVRRIGELGVAETEHDNRGSATDGVGAWWAAEPALGRVADGVAHRVDRLSALGNGQVPVVAATAFNILMERATRA